MKSDFELISERIDDMQEYVRNAKGINFTLLMLNPETGETTIHQRDNQPCQGGEMRKYAKTHGDDCTRPDDPRPGDLRHPFPDGIPIAVGVKFNSFNPHFGGISEHFVDDLLAGPYRKVVPVRTYVRNPWTNGVVGIVFWDMNVDSTAFVNMLQFLNSAQFPVWADLLELGFRHDEVANVMYLTNPGQSIRRHAVTPYSYYFSVNVCMKRLLNGEFNDLTGGTFRDRFDYNRPEVQDLFKAKKEEHGTNFMKLLASRHKWTSTYKPEYDEYGRLKYGHQPDLVDIVRDIIREEATKE